MITTHSSVSLPASSVQGAWLLATVDSIAAQVGSYYGLEVTLTAGATAPAAGELMAYLIATGETLANDAAALAALQSGQLAPYHLGRLPYPTTALGVITRWLPAPPVYQAPGGTANLVVAFRLHDALTQDLTLTARAAAIIRGTTATA